MHNEILGLGEVAVDWVAIIDHFPQPDEKIDSISQDIFGGGVTANYLVAASRLGAKTAFLGAVGKDEYGNFLCKDFQSENVNISYIYKHPMHQTPVNFIFVVTTSGEKVIIQSPYMHKTIPNESVLDLELFSQSKLIHSTAIYPDLTSKAFDLAKKNGLQISLDLEKQVVIQQDIKRLKQIIKKADILLPNKEGAMKITGASTPIDAAQKMINWGIKKVIITLGKEGSVAITEKEIIKVPGYPIKPMDTTGAGDTFCAAFDYYHVIKEYSIKEACKFANAAAAIKCLELGARTGMPNQKQINEFMEDWQKK